MVIDIRYIWLIKKNVINAIRKILRWIWRRQILLKKCNEYRKVHREKHKDRYNEEQRKRYEKDEEYRERKQEQTRLFENEVVFCSASNKSMSQTYYYDQIKAKKHQNNLENQ